VARLHDYLRGAPDDVAALVSVELCAVVLAAQGLRWWCIATLRRQWNTRVVVISDAAG
jgi:methyltransferase